MGLLLTLVLIVALPGAVRSATRAPLSTALVAPDPVTLHVGVGGTGVVRLSTMDIESLFSFELTLSFDPALVQVADADPAASGVQIGHGNVFDGLDWAILQNQVDNTAGTIDYIASLVHDHTWVDGSWTLVEITFEGLAEGAGALGLDKVILSDPLGTSIEIGKTPGAMVVGPEGPSPTPTVTATPSATPTVTPTSTVEPVGARVVLDPPDRVMALGVTSTVDIRIEDVVGLYGAEILVRYDPAIVQILDADPTITGTQIITGSFPYPDHVAVNSADNVSGTLHLAVTQNAPRPPATGSGLFGRIVFFGLTPGVSPLTFEVCLLSDGDAASIPVVSQDGEIGVFSEGYVVGQMAFQGRSTPPALDNSCPISVTFSAPGGLVPLYTIATTTDARGVFTVTTIVTGTYDMRVRDLHSLWNVRYNVPVQLGPNTVHMGTLIEGDANTDGLIDILDFSILATAFGTVVGDPGFDPRADFNNSGNIDILDFSLLATNYSRSGEIIVTAARSRWLSALAARR
jgi:hypothetical protein